MKNVGAVVADGHGSILPANAHAGDHRADERNVPETDTMPDAFDAAAQAIATRRAEEASARAMWRTHHHSDQYDRCVMINGRHVCRRCITLYPTSLLVAAISLAGVIIWPTRYDLLLIWGLSIPGTIEFVLEQLGVLRYSPRRQILVTFLVALALGRGFAYELDSRWSWEFWGPVLVFGSTWFAAAMIGHRRHASTIGQRQLSDSAR